MAKGEAIMKRCRTTNCNEPLEGSFPTIWSVHLYSRWLKLYDIHWNSFISIADVIQPNICQTINLLIFIEMTISAVCQPTSNRWKSDFKLCVFIYLVAYAVRLFAECFHKHTNARHLGSWEEIKISTFIDTNYLSHLV